MSCCVIQMERVATDSAADAAIFRSSARSMRTFEMGSEVICQNLSKFEKQALLA
jgi:hypothetical protein